MVQRQFLRADDWALIEPSDLPSLEGLLGVLTAAQGGTGLDYLGPNNTLLASTGFETRWRKITDLMIQPEYRTGTGPSIVTSTISSLAAGHVLVATAGGDWVNQAMSAAGAHDILSATHTDSLASAASRGSLIVGNSTPKWAELNLGAAGKILRSDGTDLSYSGFTIVDSGTSGGVPYYSSNTAISSSAALTANLPVIGGGAGAAPSVGTRSGNTTAFCTTTGAQTSGDVVSIDANGNHIASGTAASGLVTADSVTTFTNKTFDVAGTGNSLTTVEEHVWMTAANGSSAVALVHTGLTASAQTGSNVRTAGLTMTAAGTSMIHVTFKLPDDWSGAIDGGIFWQPSNTNSGNAVFTMASSCPTGTDTYDDAYNTASTTTTAASGTASRPQKTEFTGVDMTNAAAGGWVSFRWQRLGDDGSDTFTGSAVATLVWIKIRRTQ